MAGINFTDNREYLPKLKFKTNNMQNTIDKVVEWGTNKGIIFPENNYKQFAKVVEEVSEIGTALNTNDKEALIDAVGDCGITLIILAANNGLNFADCLESAYNVIKDRTGKTVNGVFIKNI